MTDFYPNISNNTKPVSFGGLFSKKNKVDVFMLKYGQKSTLSGESRTPIPDESIINFRDTYQIDLTKSPLKEKIKKFFKTNYLNKYTINSVQNNLNTNFDTLITENNEVESCEELSQLKLLNFKLKNEIKKANNLIKRVLIEINYYKTPNKSNRKKN